MEGALNERTRSPLATDRSGSGKTSLLNVLGGRAHFGSVSGELTLNGRAHAPRRLRRSIGYVPQEAPQAESGHRPPCRPRPVRSPGALHMEPLHAQEAALHRELSVRENLLLAARLRLDRAVTPQELSLIHI